MRLSTLFGIVGLIAVLGLGGCSFHVGSKTSGSGRSTVHTRHVTVKKKSSAKNQDHKQTANAKAEAKVQAKVNTEAKAPEPASQESEKSESRATASASAADAPKPVRATGVATIKAKPAAAPPKEPAGTTASGDQAKPKVTAKPVKLAAASPIRKAQPKAKPSGYATTKVRTAKPKVKATPIAPSSKVTTAPNKPTARPASVATAKVTAAPKKTEAKPASLATTKVKAAPNKPKVRAASAATTKVRAAKVKAVPTMATAKAGTAKKPVIASATGVPSARVAAAQPKAQPAKLTSSSKTAKAAAPKSTANATPAHASVHGSPTIKATSKKDEAEVVGNPAGRVGTAPADKKGLSCNLVSSQAPRGGQLDIKGEGFGTTPVVKIGGKVARIIRRETSKIKVQISRISNGGSVTVRADGNTATCGELKIIGKNK